MIKTWTHGAADDCMPEDILTDLAELIWQHPWWHARASLMLALLRKMNVRPPARVLDAGCGWGVNLDVLEKRGYRVTGLDISPQTLKRLDRPDRLLIEADLTQEVPAHEERYDAVIALDVIEHLNDDRQAVTRLGELTRRGGIVIVSVPALPELYSEFDSIQGHRRRYIPSTLRHAFEGSGLTIEHILWWGSWMVPILRLQRNRTLGDVAASPAETYRRYLRLPPWPISFFCNLAFAFDQPRTLRGRARQGTSLFAVARQST
jgi:SAM-dependent methyltransferase